MVLRPLGFTQTSGSGCPGDGHYEKGRPLGLAVLLHWKGYLVIRDGGYGQGSIGPPKWGGKYGPRKSGRVAEA